MQANIGTKRKRQCFSRRSDKGEAHQRPAAPRSDIGLCHQTSLLPRSGWSDLPLQVGEGSHQGSESPLARSERSDKGGKHQAPETRASRTERSDKGGNHDKSTSSPPEASLTAAQIYGEKYQSELRFLTCACCAFSHSCSGLEIRLATPLNEWRVSPFGPCDPGLGCW